MAAKSWSKLPVKLCFLEFLCFENYSIVFLSVLNFFKGERKLKLNITDDDFSCVDMYREFFQYFVNFLGSYEASMKIFRTTTAGWHKYGNFGFNWPADAGQPFPTSTHMTHHFNEVALEVIKKSQFTFHILDGYWLTVSRPDNTQVKTEQNEIGAHLVHYGPEVVSALNRQLLMLILHAICPQTLASWQPFP